MNNPNLSEDQVRALKVMEAGQNCFLAGKAGVGKSYLLKEFIKRSLEEDKNIIVCAPTGKAAQELSEFGACTVHRAFKIKSQPIIPSHIKEPEETIKAADIIIIDEISMVRIDLFEYVAKTIFKINGERLEDGSNLIQFIVVGDFAQLKPVLTNTDAPEFKKVFKNKLYAFESDYWKMFGFDEEQTILSTIHRNDSDQEYGEKLSELRRCKKQPFDNPILDWFQKETAKERFKYGITLCGYNKTVADENESKLALINDTEYISIAKIEGDNPNILNSTNAEMELKYKIGARVVMLTNGDGYCNGSTGVILGHEKNKYGKVCVKILIYGEDGDEVLVEKYKWSVFEPKVTEEIETWIDDDGKEQQKIKKIIENVEIGSIEQYPFKLGYAITIHKAQGMTLTGGVNFIPQGKQSGQLYVALSRVKSREDIFIDGKIESDNWVLDKKIKDFYKSFDKEWQDDNSD